jgi:predicted hotdog family 3-hydroxylacyl-ACP dehydratase
MQLPISVNQLQEWMPHRPPMVWIDQVIQATKNSGECSLRIKSEGYYQSEAGVRQSSLIEWVAQSYGYVSAVQVGLGLRQVNQQPKQVFLAGLRDAQFFCRTDEDELRPGKLVKIRVENSREIGPLTLFDGSVISESGKTLFKVNLKVFAA